MKKLTQWRVFKIMLREATISLSKLGHVA